MAAFAPLVDQAAAGGDTVAQDILKGAAQSLATFAAAVRGQLFEPARTGRRQLRRRSVPQPGAAGAIPNAGGTGRTAIELRLRGITVRRQGR